MKAPKALAVVLAAILLLIGAAAFTDGLGAGAGSEMLVRVEANVRDACTLCYALEGRYPPDLAYLESNYGLYVDRDKYLVSYRAFASNMPPDIRIWEVSP